MKYWAYQTQHCDQIVFSADIEADKIARKLKGRWSSPAFYSAGEPGQRDVMFQRTNRSGSGGHFYYQSEDAEREGGGGRETLSHALCKRAISELTETTLSVGNVEIPIRILERSTEKEVVIDGRRYRPDVSLQFESESDHQLKWGGTLHMEVWHTHATPEAKALDFFNAGLALFEIRVTEKLQFQTDEHLVTQAKMEQHVDWLKARFSEWIWGKLLSDPQSREYVLLENARLAKLLEQMTAKKTSTEQALAQAKVDVDQVRDELTVERHHSASCQAESSRLKELALGLERNIHAAQAAKDEHNDRALHLEQALSAALTAKNHLVEVHAEATRNLFLWRVIGIAALLGLLAVLLIWLWP